MKEIIEWNSAIEERTIVAYGNAVEKFKDDTRFTEFLRGLGDLCKSHRQVYAKFVAMQGHVGGVLRIDPECARSFDGATAAIERAVSERPVDRDELVKLVVMRELVGWNMRVAIVTYLKGFHRDFVAYSIVVQRQKNRIQAFCAADQRYAELLGKLTAVKDIFRLKILVVDDEEMIAMAVERVAGKLGDVDRVGSGAKALQLMGESYCSVVITDIWMPEMNGMDLYKAASKVFPNLKKRFIFMSSATDEATREFLVSNQLRFLQKPPSLVQIQSAIMEMYGL